MEPTAQDRIDSSGVILTGIFDPSGEIELTSECDVHVHKGDENQPKRHLFDGGIEEIMINRDGSTSMVRIEPDGRHRDCGFTGGLWIKAENIRFHNGGGWIAETNVE
jgi:hypothetical protein